MTPGNDHTVAPTQTALIITVPQAEPAVGALRERLDSSWTWGVPAHITVFYPFLAPDDVDDDALAAVRAVAAGVPRFATALARTAFFGDRVLWLAPEPDEPFRALTAALAARFPRVAPYGGEFSDVVPHLTVGHDHPRATLDAAAAEVATRLPITVAISTLRLIAGRPEPGGDWRTLAEFPLGH